jgi:integrase
MTQVNSPLPLFDALEHIEESNITPPAYCLNDGDFKYAVSFLLCYRGSRGTFNAYRREVERLLHWSWAVAKKELNQLKREDIEAFARFCQRPPTKWIGTKKPPRFIVQEGRRVPNPEWKPFVVTVSKAAHKRGERPDISKFELSQNALKEVFAILSSFFNYLQQEEHTVSNPVALIRQKSQFIRKQQGIKKIRRLSELQWQYVIKTARKMADIKPDLHERTLFIMSCLFSMYLRISELTASLRWEPTMNDFFKDQDGCWWFTTVGKGNKERQIAVSDAMLTALKRWRIHLNLSSLPSAADNSPLIPKAKGKGPITSTSYIREIVQTCFDNAVQALQKDKHNDEAEALLDATVHWLRHTGISEDVKTRPREHVRDDAGHSSGAITDRYIDIELKARHKSAKDKQISSRESND